MHTDNKTNSHDKQVSEDGPAQIPSANQQSQEASAHLGSRVSSSSKTNPMPLPNPGLKAASQSAGSVAGMLKTKSKRERSVSIESGEPRNAAPPVLDNNAKGEGVMRSKRRCVLEKKQPYSGDEWCSGPDTEEDEDKKRPPVHRERRLTGPIQSLSSRLFGGSKPDPGGTPVGCEKGPGVKAERPKPSQQVVYVFTTSLANSAAEAVLKGQSESILVFHQQNVPHAKMEQGQLIAKFPKQSEKLNLSCSPTCGTPKSQSGTPRPGSADAGSFHPTATSPSTEHLDNKGSQTGAGAAPSINSRSSSRSDRAGLDPATRDGDEGGAVALPAAIVSPSGSPSILSAHLQNHAVLRKGPGSTDGLSKEQLEHRARSLQTLRDIERLLLRSGEEGGHGDPGGSSPNSSSNVTTDNTDRNAVPEERDNGTVNSRNCGSGNLLSTLASMERLKKFEEPLQSIISQTQSLSGPMLESPQMHSPHILSQHPHHQLSSPRDDMGPLLGPEGLTPEQMAWRKLQEEYYQEKKRQQEVLPSTHSQHFRMMAEMHGGPMMIRGPPPPYHSKPIDQQWGSGSMMGGGMGGNGQIINMHQDGVRGPRSLGQIQRGQPGIFPGNSELFSMHGPGTQRPPRPGMIWVEDMPNNMSGGSSFHGSYVGPPQGDPDLLLSREERFRIMEKRHMQGLSKFELERLAKQQQQQGSFGPRLMNSLGGPDFPIGLRRCAPINRGDPVDFAGSQELMGSPGGGPQIRDLMDSPLGGNIAMNMNAQQQQMLLSQKLRGGPSEGGPLAEMFGPGEMSRIRALQNGRGGNKGMIPGADGSFQYELEEAFLHQAGPEIFGSEQHGPNPMELTARLSHIPVAGGMRGGPRNTSELSVNVHPITSVPRHSLNMSPSLNPEQSTLLPSPSAPGLKSPSLISSMGHHPPRCPASGAGTPPSSSMKSPQIMGTSNLALHSPSASPGRLKSPVMNVGSPGWMSPKTALPSPRGLTSGKGFGNGGSNSTEAGPALQPRSSSSTPISQSGSMNPSMPFTSSPEARPSQNPLSLIMFQMSKYALPSSTPLYHEAIKTIATSDDEMLPDRPLLAGVCLGGNPGNPQASHILVSQGSIGPHSDPQSPMGIVGQDKQLLSHDSMGALPSPSNQMSMPSLNSTPIGGEPLEGMGMASVPHNQMAGFPRMHPLSRGPMHSPSGGMSQSLIHINDNILPHHQMHLLNKRPPHPLDSANSRPLRDGPDLSDVIRPSHTGIPEFDLSRIIPSDKPSSTLQYFPKTEPHQNQHQGPLSYQHPPQQLLKQLSSGPLHGSGSSSNPHLVSLQNMMAEQQPPPHPSHAGIRQGMGIPPGVMRGVLSAGGPMCQPAGHMMGRGSLLPQHQLQQSVGPYPGMMPPQQHAHHLITQQNNMMMRAKHPSISIPGEPFGHQGPLMSPQGPMMVPSNAQSGMMGPQPLRERGMSLDSSIGFGPGGMANMPF